jgi:hypothetical protein
MDGRSAQREQPVDAAEPESAASNLFDLRILIGALFTFYGLVLIVTGALAGSAELHKAAGININLWMGIGMLVLGVLFLIWWRFSPLRVQRAPAVEQPEAPRAVQKEQSAQ